MAMKDLTPFLRKCWNVRTDSVFGPRFCVVLLGSGSNLKCRPQNLNCELFDLHIYQDLARLLTETSSQS